VINAIVAADSERDTFEEYPAENPAYSFPNGFSDQSSKRRAGGTSQASGAKAHG
jgi:hypothetical protein